MPSGDRNLGPAKLAYDWEPATVQVDGLVKFLVRKMLGRWIDKTLFHRAVQQPVPTLAGKQPAIIPNSVQIDTGPRPPPPGSTHRLELADEHLVIENLPAVRVAARRIYGLLPDHVSFARIYSAGVMGLVAALEEFHASNPVRFADFAKPKSGMRFSIVCPTLSGKAEELRQKGQLIEAAIHELRAELDHAPTEVEISHELHIDVATYHHLLDDLEGIEIGTQHSQRLKGSGEEDVVNLAGLKLAHGFAFNVPT